MFERRGDVVDVELVLVLVGVRVFVLVLGVHAPTILGGCGKPR